MIRAELHIKFEMEFPKDFNLSSLKEKNITVSKGKMNSSVAFAYSFENKKHMYNLGSSNRKIF